MSLKNKINNKGLKIKFVAKQLDINYNSLRVWLSNEKKMPYEVELKLRQYLT
tara:strand:- start:305 stop:460 length:156 start_codon:yes stop_codon:yes gene_type:complete